MPADAEINIGVLIVLLGFYLSAIFGGVHMRSSDDSAVAEIGKWLAIIGFIMLALTMLAVATLLTRAYSDMV